MGRNFQSGIASEKKENESKKLQRQCKQGRDAEVIGYTGRQSGGHGLLTGNHRRHNSYVEAFVLCMPEILSDDYWQEPELQPYAVGWQGGGLLLARCSRHEINEQMVYEHRNVGDVNVTIDVTVDIRLLRAAQHLEINKQMIDKHR